MKKIILLVLALMTLVGCGGSDLTPANEPRPLTRSEFELLRTRVIELEKQIGTMNEKALLEILVQHGREIDAYQRDINGLERCMTEVKFALSDIGFGGNGNFYGC